MRKLIRRIAQVACLAIAFPAVITAGVAHAAPAQPAVTGPGNLAYHAWADKCEFLLWRNGIFVRAEVYLSQTATIQTCSGELFRGPVGEPMDFESGVHYVSTPGGTAYTDWYADGPGYLASACGEEYNNISSDGSYNCTALN